MKDAERILAIRLRTEGRTYSEIRGIVPVAKSTLSVWFRSVGLASEQQQRITQKRIAAALRGAEVRRATREREVRALAQQGTREIGGITRRELWLIGIALYWAEGAKQNRHAPSAPVMFANSDYRMHHVFISWLDTVGIARKDVLYELYVHESRRSEAHGFLEWWREKLTLSSEEVIRLYFKQGNTKTNRHNTADLYHGLLRIKVKSSTVLNRRIQGWSRGIAEHLGSGVIGNTSAFGAEDSRFDP